MSQIKSLLLVIAILTTIALLSYLVNYKSLGTNITGHPLNNEGCSVELLTTTPISTIPYNGVESITDPILIQVTSPEPSPLITIKPATKGVLIANNLNDSGKDELTFIAPGSKPKFQIYLLVDSNNPPTIITLNITLTKHDKIICEKQLNITLS